MITITIPLPPKGLSPNARVHWARKASLTREYRRHARVAAVNAAIDLLGDDVDQFPWMRSVAAATFYWPDKRRRDLRNAEHALKAAYDGIVDACIIADDNADQLTHEPTRFEVDKQRPRVEIRVRPDLK